MKKSAVIIMFIVTVSLYSQDDPDSLFDTGNMIETEEEVITEQSPEKEVLINKGVDIGGSFYSTFRSSWIWYEDSDDSDLAVDLGAKIFLDARPDENFRFFLKVSAFYPFSESGWSSELNNAGVEIVELFSDFNIKNRIFFRTGKQTVKWGVGYFFSPADVINLSRIDPEDPEEEREGPIALKIHIPLGVNNLYFYTIAENIDKPEDLSFAPKFEFVISRTEIGIGGIYRKDYAPRGMVTISTSIADVRLFGEAVVSYGSDKTFIEETDDFISYPPGIKTYNENDRIFFSGTLGFSYTVTQINLMFTGQYYFNGEGYSDGDLWHDNAAGIIILQEQGEISANDLVYRSRHYGAGSINYMEMFGSDISLSVFWIGSFLDFSGQIKPSIIWTPAEYVKISAAVPVFYGDRLDEYTLTGKNVRLEISLSIGGGKF
jgi:hypothetical protein